MARPLAQLGDMPYPITDTGGEICNPIGNFVYKNDTLQYILNGEGRARPVLNADNNTRFVYDYFVKDHLGNVRSTVTAEPMNLAYVASHEIAMAGTEQLVFDNIPNVRDTKPGGGGGDAMAVRLNASESDKRIGTAIMLHAMPGDRFTISADAFYEGSYQQSTEEVGSDVIVQSLAAALTGGTTYEGVPVSELPANAKLAGSLLNDPSLAATLATLAGQTNNPAAPKAHLNVLFFNQDMQLIPQVSSVTQVNVNQVSGNGWTTLTPTGGYAGAPICCTMPEPGYVVIYVDNQSMGKDVWFDNIMVGHYTGTVQEESHYYPFGLTLQTDVQVPEVTKQVYKYNGKELEQSFGLEIYDYGARNYDPAAPHWWQIDPKAEKYNSVTPYNYALNNPVKYIDPDGRDARVSINGNKITLSSTVYVMGANAQEQTDKYNQYVKDNPNLQSGSYTDDDGNEWTINLDITYKVGTEDDKKRIAESPNGDNVLELNTDGQYANAWNIDGRSPTGQQLKENPDKPNVITGRYNGIGRMTKIGIGLDGKSTFSNGLTGFHETLHLFGLEDRYEKDRTTNNFKSSHPGYEKDVMGIPNNFVGTPVMNQSHFNNWGKYIINNKVQSGSIINVTVDKNPATQELE